MEKCYSVRACKQNLYITDVNGDAVTLGSKENRLIFYVEIEAEKYQKLCDDTMDDCFQIVTEKESAEHLIERIIASDNAKPYGEFFCDSDTILANIMTEVELDVSGVAHEIFKIYNAAKDKESVAALFEAILGVSFLEYLSRCEETIDG